MANNYYEATGTLVLGTVTPVVHALFGAFKLDAKYPGDGECYIANLSEVNEPNWDDIRQALVALARERGLAPTDGVHDETDAWLRALCADFGDQDDKLASEIAGFEDSVWVGDVFEIAQKLDDGHGLKAVKLEGCWHCSKPRLFEFGGAGHFITNDCRVGVASGDAIEYGIALQEALDGGNLDNVAAVAFEQVQKILGSLQDEETRNAVKRKLAAKLATAAGQEGS